jgi:predicted RND superfamily exporter protein
MTRFEQFRERFIERILKYPKTFIFVGFFYSIVFAIGVFNATTDFTPRVWFSPDSKEIKNLDLFEKRFGGDQFISVGVYNDGNKVATHDFLDLVLKLTDELQYLDEVIRVDSISNFNYISTEMDDITITPLFEEGFDPKQVQSRFDEIEELKNNILSQNEQFTIIYARLAPLFEKSPNYTDIINDLEVRLKPYEKEGFRFVKLGNVSVTQAFRHISYVDNITILPLVFLCIIILLFIFYRSLLAVAVPIIISVLTIGGTLGLVGYFGIVFNSILAAVPAIILAICLADTVHIMTSYFQKVSQGMQREEAMRFAMHKNFLATILTSITTSISFFTIASSELMPIKDLGILSGIGCILAWINTYFFLAPFFLTLPEKWSKVLFMHKEAKTAEASRFANFIMKAKFPIIIIFVIISGTSVYLGSKNEVNSDPIQYFADESTLKKDYVFTKSFFEGLRGIDVVIDSGVTDGAKDPVFLNKVQSLINTLMKDPTVFKVTSILDPIKKMNQELNQGKAEYKRIPDTKNQVAEALFLYTLGLPASGGIDNQVTVDYRYLKLHVRWSLETTKEAMAKEDEIHALAKSLGLESHTGGFFPLYTQVNNLVVDSFFRSMSMAVLFVSVIIFLFFREIGLSFLAMLPNVIPLALGAGVMYFMGIYLDIGTSIVAAICLGIAVDDTIHFVTHYAVNRRQSGDTLYALNETYRSTGQALILTTILLVVGFGMFVFSEFLPNRYFGILCAIILSMALVTDLLFLPAILASFYKKKDNN